MITVRAASERGRSSTGWLHSAHSFSFGDYFDLRHQGHGNLLVLNDDTVAPGKGFATHGHRDMEIVSYVLDGALAHKDDLESTAQPLGPGSTPHAPTAVLRPGDVQRISAGRGVRHSEFNPLADQDTRFLQIWIRPVFTGIRASYEQRHFAAVDRRGRLVMLAARRGPADPAPADGPLGLNADATIWAGLLDGDESAHLDLDVRRLAYVHLARGTLRANGVALGAGDGALLDGESQLRLDHGSHAEVLVLDLARR